MLSWREITETIGMDVRECTKKWENYRDKNVYPPPKKPDHNKEQRPRRERSPSILFVSVGWHCMYTAGTHHMAFNTQ